jgi:hypothetical protein
MFLLPKLLKKLMQAVVNLHPLTQEFYEEALCWSVPASEMKIVLGRSKP